jgi:hypothetical protein
MAENSVRTAGNGNALLKAHLEAIRKESPPKCQHPNCGSESEVQHIDGGYLCRKHVIELYPLKCPECLKSEPEVTFDMDTSTAECDECVGYRRALPNAYKQLDKERGRT